ncbi:MAG: hypothetical protein AAF628_21770 [Planctomycetota bacterium]
MTGRYRARPSRGRPLGWPLVGALLAISAPTAAQQPDPALLQLTVGMRGRIDELALPGAKLRPRPVEDPLTAKVIVRILNVYAHGSGFRYNLEVTPFVPGTLDLRAHLERADGTAAEGLPALPIEVEAVLPASRLQPGELVPEPSLGVGGYQLRMILLGVAWVVGLLLILFVGRRRRRGAAADEAAPPPTLADRLRPLVERARDGQLAPGEQAELERLLLAHWRRRLGLTEQSAGKAVAELRRHEEAGALLRQLEAWLHQPAAAGRRRDVDLGALLAPYRHLLADEAAPA